MLGLLRGGRKRENLSFVVPGLRHPKRLMIVLAGRRRPELVTAADKLWQIHVSGQ